MEQYPMTTQEVIQEIEEIEAAIAAETCPDAIDWMLDELSYWCDALSAVNGDPLND